LAKDPPGSVVSHRTVGGWNIKVPNSGLGDLSAKREVNAAPAEEFSVGHGES